MPWNLPNTSAKVFPFSRLDQNHFSSRFVSLLPGDPALVFQRLLVALTRLLVCLDVLYVMHLSSNLHPLRLFMLLTIPFFFFFSWLVIPPGLCHPFLGELGSLDGSTPSMRLQSIPNWQGVKSCTQSNPSTLPQFIPNSYTYRTPATLPQSIPNWRGVHFTIHAVLCSRFRSLFH